MSDETIPVEDLTVFAACVGGTAEYQLIGRLARQLLATKEEACARYEAYEQYIEKAAEEHEAERSKTILNANKVRKLAAKIATERNAALDMVKAAQELLDIIHEDAGHHTEAVGFTQSCKDACDEYYNLVDRLESALTWQQTLPTTRDQEGR